MPTTPTLTLCDDLVTLLVATWNPTGDDGAERAYFKRWGDGRDPVSLLQGRRVTIYPLDYTNGPATRGEDEFEHTVGVQVLERHEEPGDPSVAWIDERVDFVYEFVVQLFDFLREVPSFNRFLWTKSAAVRVYDVDHLTTQGQVFFSEVTIVFGEYRSA